MNYNYTKITDPTKKSRIMPAGCLQEIVANFIGLLNSLKVYPLILYNTAIVYEKKYGNKRRKNSFERRLKFYVVGSKPIESAKIENDSYKLQHFCPTFKLHF